MRAVNGLAWALGIVTATVALLVFVLSGNPIALRIAGAGALAWIVCGRVERGYESREALAQAEAFRLKMAALGVLPSGAKS